MALVIRPANLNGPVMQAVPLGRVSRIAPALPVAQKDFWGRCGANLGYYASWVGACFPSKTMKNLYQGYARSCGQYSKLQKFVNALNTPKSRSLVKGLDPNAIFGGRSLLQRAYDAGDAEAVSALIVAGAEISDIDYQNLLQGAADSANAVMMEALFVMPRPNLPGATAILHTVVFRWPQTNVSVVLGLLKLGACLDDAMRRELSNCKAQPALEMAYVKALQTGDAETVRVLVQSRCLGRVDLRKNIIEGKKRNVKCPVAGAICRGVSALRGDLFNTDREQRDKLIICAIDSEDRALLDHYTVHINNRSRNLRGAFKPNPKHMAYAVQKGKAVSVVGLLDAGHTIAPKDVKKEHLVKALELGKVTALQTLLDASECDRLPLVEIALNMPNSSPITTQLLAVLLTHKEGESEPRPSMWQKMIQTALAKGNTALALKLATHLRTEYGFRLKDDGIKKYFPQFLHAAVKAQNKELVQNLTAIGASVHEVVNGKSILQYMVETGLLDSMDAIRAKYFLHYICEHYGKTPTEETPPFSQVLMADFGDLFELDKKGRSPLSILAERNDWDKLRDALQTLTPQEMNQPKLMEILRVIKSLGSIDNPVLKQSLLCSCLQLFRGNIHFLPLSLVLPLADDLRVFHTLLADPGLIAGANGAALLAAANRDRTEMISLIGMEIREQDAQYRSLCRRLGAAEVQFRTDKKAAPYQKAVEDFGRALPMMEGRIRHLQALLSFMRAEVGGLEADHITEITNVKNDARALRSMITRNYLQCTAAMRSSEKYITAIAHPNKKAVYETLNRRAILDTSVGFSKHQMDNRFSIDSLSFADNAAPGMTEIAAGDFQYPAGDARTVHWTAHFADRGDLFAYGAGGDLSGSEHQVAEHPGLHHLSCRLSKMKESRLADNQVALVSGAKKYGALALSGKAFGKATADQVRANLRVVGAPVESNFFAMTAPKVDKSLLGKTYKREHLEEMFLKAYTAFLAIKLQNPGKQIVIHTGNLGEGAGARASALCQLAAARCAGIDDVQYYSKGKTQEFDDAVRDLQRFMDEHSDQSIGNFLFWVAANAKNLNVRYG
jgi:hypothetical protein